MESLWKILVVFGCVYFMKMYQVVWSRDRLPNTVFLGFPGGSDGKESACIVGNLDSIPGLGRSPGGGHGNALQYYCLENPQGQRNLVGYSPWGRKESDITEWLSTHSTSVNHSSHLFTPHSSHSFGRHVMLLWSFCAVPTSWNDPEFCSRLASFVCSGKIRHVSSLWKCTFFKRKDYIIFLFMPLMPHRVPGTEY